MTRRRLHSAGFLCFAGILLAGGASAQNSRTVPPQALQCSYWSNDPNVEAVRTVRVKDVRVYPAETEIASMVHGGRTISGNLEVRSGSVMAGQPAYLHVANEGVRDVRHRLAASVQASLREAETGERRDFISGRIHWPEDLDRETLHYSSDINSFDCLSVPGSSVLVSGDGDILDELRGTAEETGRMLGDVVGDIGLPDDRDDGRATLWLSPDNHAPLALLFDGLRLERGPARGRLGPLVERPPDRDSPQASSLSDLVVQAEPPSPVPSRGAPMLSSPVAEASTNLAIEERPVVCTTGQSNISVRGLPPEPRGDILLAGRRGLEDRVALFGLDPLDGAPVGSDRVGRFEASDAEIDVLRAPRIRWLEAEGFVSEARLLLAPVASEVLSVIPEATPVSREAIRIAVFADPVILAKSGLYGLDSLLRERRDTGWPIEITWHRISVEGAIADPRTFDLATDMLAAAGAAGPVSDPLYNDTAVLRRVLDGMERRILEDGRPLDLVIWVVRGTQFPPTAPARLSSFIERVSAHGPLARRPAGNRPGEWFFILAGNFAQDFARSYVEGPVRTAVPGAAALEVATVARTREGQLLEDLDQLARQIDGNLRLRFGAESLPPRYDASVLYSSMPAFHRVGFLVPRERLRDLHETFEQATVILSKIASYDDFELGEMAFNPFAFWMVTTGETGEVLNSGFSPAAVERKLSFLSEQEGALRRAQDDFDRLRSATREAKDKLDGATACSHVFVAVTNSPVLWSGP